MTTPMNVYTELAIKYGNIDADDLSAVHRFFEIEVYKLPEKSRLEIVDALFSRMDESPSPEILQDTLVDEYVPLPDPANYESLNSKRSKKTVKLTAIMEEYLKSV